MLVFPGGGYYMVSDRENEPIALSYFAAGYQVFVLKYTLGKEHTFDEALTDADGAVARIRAMAEEWNLDPHKVAVCGFSAGGHLAASTGTLLKNRPDAMVLAYPCILGNLSTAFPVPRLDEAVDENTPPAFLFHTRDDEQVPVAHTLRFADALDKAGRPFELHVFRHGAHGAALATGETGESWADDHVAKWMPLSIEWLAETLDFH